MTYHPRTPPKLKIPDSSRWTAVLRVRPESEIWILDLRKAFPYHFIYVFCDLKNGQPLARRKIPTSEEDLKIDDAVVDFTGRRYFWSEKEQVLVVQCVSTFGPAECLSEITQRFLAAPILKVVKALSKTEIIFLPNKDYQEVMPEIHPDSFR